MNALEMKIAAAAAALEFVEDGSRLGIGTGSTADEFVRLLAAKINKGFKIQGVPTSERTAKLCYELGVPLFTLEELPELDLTVDGADELDSELALIKGGGGALLREKIVACASKKMIVIADESKVVETLGAFPLPVEVNKFGLKATENAVFSACDQYGCQGNIVLRMNDDSPFETDGGHFILDASFGRILDAEGLSKALLEVPGVVQHGLFINIATTAVIAGQSGVRLIKI